MAKLLTQNSELRPLGIHNWTLPAWVVRLSDGRNVNVCEQAGACVKLCYARQGAYRFPGVAAAHERNLRMVMDDMGGWTLALLNELDMPRFKPKGVPWLPGLDRAHLDPVLAGLLDAGAPLIRIHDSGDFMSDEYLAAWVHIATLRPDVVFYAYTKEVSRVRRVVPNRRTTCLSATRWAGARTTCWTLLRAATSTPMCSPTRTRSTLPGTTTRTRMIFCASWPRRHALASPRTTFGTCRSSRATRHSAR